MRYLSCFFIFVLLLKFLIYAFSCCICLSLFIHYLSLFLIFNDAFLPFVLNHLSFVFLNSQCSRSSTIYLSFVFFINSLVFFYFIIRFFFFFISLLIFYLMFCFLLIILLFLICLSFYFFLQYTYLIFSLVFFL